MKRLDQLTFTRFIIILLVLFYHNTGGVYFDAINFFPLSTLYLAAPTGVAYLYVLSGFVMAFVYYRPDGKMDVFSYWKSRFIRIYPLYIISFALMCVYYFDALFQIKPQKIIANLFVVQAWIPAYSQSFNYSSWSLTVEFFFYAIFPFYVLWASKQSTRKLIWTALALWLVTQIVHYPLWVGYYDQLWEVLTYYPLFHLNSFILGVVGGIWLLREGQNSEIKPRTILTVLTGTFLLLAGYAILSTDIMPSLPHKVQPIAGLMSPLLVLFIVALSLDRSILSRALSHPALVNLGETSYALYILHVPVFWLVERALETYYPAGADWVFSVAFLPMMIALGLIVHFYVDTPLRKWLKDFLKNINIPLFLADLAILSFAAFFVIKFRFGNERDYLLLYRWMERLVFWVAFFVRPALALAFGTYRTEVLMRPGLKWALPVLYSVSLGSLVIALSVYWGYATGWFENFPRSVFFMDWLIVALLSLAARFIFRHFNKPKEAPIST